MITTGATELSKTIRYAFLNNIDINRDTKSPEQLKELVAEINAFSFIIT